MVGVEGRRLMVEEVSRWIVLGEVEDLWIMEEVEDRLNR